MVVIKMNNYKLQEARMRAGPEMAKKAISMAINEASSRNVGGLRKLVNANYNTKAAFAREGRVKNFTYQSYATPNHLVGGLIATGTRFRILDFLDKKQSKEKGALLTATVIKGKSVTLGRGIGGYGSARFMATMRKSSGHEGVFFRLENGKMMKSNPKKEAIDEMFTISAPEMMGSHKVADPAMDRMEDVFLKRLEHHITRLM